MYPKNHFYFRRMHPKWGITIASSVGKWYVFPLIPMIVDIEGMCISDILPPRLPQAVTCVALVSWYCSKWSYPVHLPSKARPKAKPVPAVRNPCPHASVFDQTTSLHVDILVVRSSKAYTTLGNVYSSIKFGEIKLPATLLNMYESILARTGAPVHGTLYSEYYGGCSKFKRRYGPNV